MSATYDSAMWTIHEDMMKRTKAWENAAMRNILRLRWKKKVESYPQYMERSSRLVAGRFAEWKIAQTFHKIIKGIYFWWYKQYHFQWGESEYPLRTLMLYCRGLRPLAEEEAKHSSAVSRDDNGEWRYRTAGARLSEDIEFI